MKNKILVLFLVLSTVSMAVELTNPKIEKKIDKLLAKMTLEEKIGQMVQKNSENNDNFKKNIADGKIGSILNEVDPNVVNEYQKAAVEKSRMGIPLIIGRDVIHGFQTIFPVPLAQAATWNPELVEKGARIAATEAASQGVRWTFAPMIDISRDARWGRIVETVGEDPYLSAELGAAMVRGFQGNDLSDPTSIAACAKHFAGYGAAEGGRDYNTTYIPEQQMRDLYLRTFQAAEEAGAATFMCAFNDINGVPASGNKFLMKQVLRDEWDFQGFVVSDWASMTQMIPHGFCKDNYDVAYKSVMAGVDMEMQSPAYEQHLANMVNEGSLDIAVIDEAVRNVLRVKMALGLFENPYTDPSKFPTMLNDEHLAAAKETALQSIVMLKNDNNTLPIAKDTKVAVIGPLADDKYEQLGTWSFDMKIETTQTPLMAITEMVGKDNVKFAETLEISRDHSTANFDSAITAVKESDIALLFLGEEAILSGEAHCRANIDLPGAQEELIHTLAELDKPIVLVVLAGRPITMGKILDKVDAILYAWHPGTMGGPALADIIYGIESPSGKLPVTFPKVVGQIPIYYNHKNTGRPPRAESWKHIDDIPVRPWQTSLGNESHYMDAGFEPQFHFGYGLSYTTFEYSDLKLSSNEMKLGGSIKVSATIKNTGKIKADEIVQLYTRDLVADITRPVAELKKFDRITLDAGESKTVEFTLNCKDLSFHNQEMKLVTEPGDFDIWVGPYCKEGVKEKFTVLK